MIYRNMMLKISYKLKRKRVRYAVGKCVTPGSLKNKLEINQDSRCYWMPNYKIDPMLIFETHNPMAMSIDRLDNSRGYFLDNIVITVTGINRMRNECPPDKFRIILDYWMSSTDGPIGLSPLFAEYREDLLKDNNAVSSKRRMER